MRITRPYKIASREFIPEDTKVEFGGQSIGGNDIIIIAGPCSVESREQLLETAHAVREAGGHALRGGAFKPRTSPYSFQGLGEEGLQYLAEAREQTGLAVVTEVMSVSKVPMVMEYADVLQIGARNMQNYTLLHEVGESQFPVLLKRGMSATIQELLMAAEYILSHGNRRVMLCERGIRTFETATRQHHRHQCHSRAEVADPFAGYLGPQPQHRQLGFRNCYRPCRHCCRGRRFNCGSAPSAGRSSLRRWSIVKAGTICGDGAPSAENCRSYWTKSGPCLNRWQRPFPTHNSCPIPALTLLKRVFPSSA